MGNDAIYEDFDFEHFPDLIEMQMPILGLLDWSALGYHCFLIALDQGVLIRAPQHVAQFIWEVFWDQGVRCRGRMIVPFTDEWAFYAETTPANARRIVSLARELAGVEE